MQPAAFCCSDQKWNLLTSAFSVVNGDVAITYYHCCCFIFQKNQVFYENLQYLCSVCVERKQAGGKVCDVVKETVDWLQLYFSMGLAGNLPTVCALSDSRCGNQLFLCFCPLFTHSLWFLMIVNQLVIKILPTKICFD